MRPDRFGRPKGLSKASLQRVIRLNTLPVLKSKFPLQTWMCKRERTHLLVPEMNQTRNQDWGATVGGPTFRKEPLDWGALMHRAGLACRLLTSAVSFSSAECSSHLATVQGNSHHHQLNTVWSNCTEFLQPLFPSLPPLPT